MKRRSSSPPQEPAVLERPPGADNALEQPSDDKSDRAASADVGAKAPNDLTQRAERGSRDPDAPRRGAPPGMAPPKD